ncbi:RNA polymerase sigma-54 factor [Bacillus sp. MUM 116]|uniref:RNA polymerase factor sigma-54 n=1 Tax=Bacillus sp. MUM 116 TaxID=1678002 RepID=UPI0008F58C95|nr:RNA polymerase factor sigma-54 [Bacillus sp. MUM 116]OIK16400.1 RNA polymerase sigma-54 factor [Bacillus sp. MUM 116]
MNLKAGLWQQQTLKLTMTQELTQAIALLQYSAMELNAFLENKALENPLMQIENGNVQPMNPLIDRNRKKSQKAEKDWIEQIAGKTVNSLENQLISQLNLRKLTPEQLKTIRHLIHNLDENGYLSGDLADMAKMLKVSEEFVEECLIIIQTLEPVGIGARNLQECLLIQIEWEYPDHELAHKIISDYFVPFADKKWKQIAKELQVSLKDIQEVFDLIQLLNPKPGALLGHEDTTYVIPDVIIEKYGDEYTIRMCDDSMPRLSFNDGYYKKFSGVQGQDPSVVKFLQDKMQDYQWIMKSIEQRKETLTKVVAKILEKQVPFFQKGPHYLLPMIMKDIANELEIHESTVSRAVREKYVQTPIGTFPLKSFFTSTIQTTSDENTSSTLVKKAISSLIEREDKQKPLSDQDIVEQLKNAEGMVISRRTVAKYRDQLGIPSSSKRKRFN